MSNSSRYFKLSDDILLEYVYTDITQNRDGECEDLVDLQKNSLLYVDNSFDNKRYIFFADNIDESDGFINNSVENLALSTNKVGSKYVKAASIENSNNRYWGNNSLGKISNAKRVNSEDLFFDTVILHFTGKNYWGRYSSYIIRSYVNDCKNNTINLSSILLEKDYSPYIDANPLFINQKIYNTHIKFRIPSVADLYQNNILSSNKLEKNAPIRISLIGVNNTTTDNIYKYFNCETLNTITIPYLPSYGDITLTIEEASDGDYFILRTGTNSHRSFSDYICSIDDNPDAYVIMHEISLIEYSLTSRSEPKADITHREYYLVNISDARTDESAKKLLDTPITYRPICVHSDTDYSFVIEDTLKILNTIDNTTVIIKGSIEVKNPSKYGKYMRKINLGKTPSQVNVYNKRTDSELDSVLIHNSKSSELKVENHQYSIQEFVECVNIGVTVQDISAADIE